MTPEVGQRVKCFLRNGNVVEGSVQSWLPDEVVLLSLNGETLMIIHNPKQDILMTKVVLSEASEQTAEIPKSKPTFPVVAATLEEGFHLLTTEEDDDVDPMALRAKSTAELKIELAKQERKIISEKLRDHHPDTQMPRRKIYGYPRFFTKQST